MSIKRNPIGSNQTEIDKPNGISILYSYSTPVAAFVPGKGGLVTTKFYSRTTSKHIGLALRRWGATRVEVDQGVIDQYAESDEPLKRPYQPKTGEPCTCKRGIERDNCPVCEGTGMKIDFAAIRART